MMPPDRGPVKLGKTFLSDDDLRFYIEFYEKMAENKEKMFRAAYGGRVPDPAEKTEMEWL